MSHLDNPMMLHSVVVAAMVLVAGPGAIAQDLADPMRPRGMAVQRIAEPAAAHETATAVAPMVVQSIMIVGRRRVAVVDRQPVGVGDRVGEAEVIAIGESDVTIRNEEGTSVLKMHPKIEKTPRTVKFGDGKSAKRPENNL